MDRQPLLHQQHNHDDSSNTVAITIEKDSVANARSLKEGHSVQRSFGFKSMVIYVLLFVNLLLCSKLFSTWYSGNNNKNNIGAFNAAGGSCDCSTLGEGEGGEHEGGDASTPEFWIKMALILFLVLIGGVFAGLTIGLMGLDETNLQVLMASGTPKEQVHAETVYKLLSRGKHWVLVTLLLGNVIVNETLPVVLDSELGGGVVAILISTLLIVVFGEIIPQAACARYGLAIGSYCAKPMLVFMYIMAPISYPIAMLLDKWLGVDHGTTYRRTELKTLVSLHQVDLLGELTDDEVTIIASVLDLKEKAISTVMTPLEDVFTLSEDAILDEQLMEEIVNSGHSRIPIYRHDDPGIFIGMLLVKRLITYDPKNHIPVRQFKINSLPEAAPNTSCLDILNFFQEGRSHMAIVTSEPGGFGHPVGVITLEDVIEELLGEEIVDESDVYVDIHNKIRVIRKPSKNVKMIKSLKSLLQSPAITDASPLLGNKGTGSDRRTATMPIENNYMATGKTILLRSPSAALLDNAAKAQATHANTAANAHIPATPTEQEASSSTVVSPKATIANGNKDSHVVNFKDQVKVIQEMASKDTPEEIRERSVTIEVPDTESGGVYTIDPPSDAAVTDAAGDSVSAQVQVVPETPVASVVAKDGEEVIVEEVTPRSAEVQIEAERPKEMLTDEPTEMTTTTSSSGTGALPGSESTSTLMSTTTLNDKPAVNSPASTSSKKKKNKKKKSTK
ncbi:DUF21-domain-containing protein [Linnemannia elongata AG-77]|uniref:DUF21-domain-containing protein n=1 Tax=Linnemannia elongata AG-77 TaxID=1314771 RepID=A0A197KFK7_9FUNG|nr:DUF21-domain-containing protein [Linnemannia elongata AG-77]